MVVSKVRKKKKKTTKKIDYSKFKNKIIMSQVILDYAKPLTRNIVDIDEMNNMISFAVTIWNLSMLPDENREETKMMIYKALENSDGFEDIEEIVEGMIKRRETEFGYMNRLIVKYDIAEDGDGYRLDIQSHEI